MEKDTEKNPWKNICFFLPIFYKRKINSPFMEESKIKELEINSKEPEWMILLKRILSESNLSKLEVYSP